MFYRKHLNARLPRMNVSKAFEMDMLRSRTSWLIISKATIAIETEQ